MPLRVSVVLFLLLGSLTALSGRAEAASACPNLTILLDTSGSMLENPAGPIGVTEPSVSGRKSSIAIAALTTLVQQYDGLLPIGLALFPADGMCGTAQLNIPPALLTGPQILKLLQKSAPSSMNPYTPTAASIRSLSKMAALKDAARPQYILLLTDGRPECADGSESVAKAVAALQAAARATPSIKTFVVGFGRLDATSQAAMNQMADAGGVPSGDSQVHYFQAGDAASLGTALDKILLIISGELGAMMCGDSCYTTGCPNAGEKCIARSCQKDPCSGVTCTAGEYCYTDGASAGACVSSCPTPCGAGTYCDRGQCVTGPCGLLCGPGKVCNPATHACEADEQCATLTPKCLAPRGCVAGKCIDDPCGSNLIACPPGTHCQPWEGTCQPPDNANGNSPAPDGGTIAEGGCNMRRGTQGAHRVAFIAALCLLAVLYRRHRLRA